MHLDIGQWNRLSLRDSKSGRCVYALQYEVGVKVLRTRQNLNITPQGSKLRNLQGFGLRLDLREPCRKGNRQ